VTYVSISVGAFAKAFCLGLWQIKFVLLWIAIVLFLDVVAMGVVSPARGAGVREAIGWFFGNGSGVQILSRSQLGCCIFAATLGYIFLGTLLAVLTLSFKHAETR